MLMPFISGTTEAYTEVERMSASSEPPCSLVTAAFWSPLKLVPFGTTVTTTEPLEVFFTWSAKCWAETPTEEVSGSGMDSWILATGEPPPGAPEAQPARTEAARVHASTPVRARVFDFMCCLSSLEGVLFRSLNDIG